MGRHFPWVCLPSRLIFAVPFRTQAQKDLASAQKQLAAREAEVIVLNGTVAKLKDDNATLLRRAEKAERAQKVRLLALPD